jgi:hypothetical protein
MKYKQFPSFFTVATIAIFIGCSGVLTGCLPAPGSSPTRGERKKMFTLDEPDGVWEGYSLSSPVASNVRPDIYTDLRHSGEPGAVAFPPLPFALSDTLLSLGAEPKSFVLLRLPAADYDFLLLGAKNYEAYFQAWLKSWSQTGREGLVIDLAAAKVSGRSVFQLTGPGLENPVPLVLLWDAASEARAGFYSQLLQSLTTINCH